MNKDHKSYPNDLWDFAKRRFYAGSIVMQEIEMKFANLLNQNLAQAQLRQAGLHYRPSGTSLILPSQNYQQAKKIIERENIKLYKGI